MTWSKVRCSCRLFGQFQLAPFFWFLVLREMHGLVCSIS